MWINRYVAWVSAGKKERKKKGTKHDSSVDSTSSSHIRGAYGLSGGPCMDVDISKITIDYEF